MFLFKKQYPDISLWVEIDLEEVITLKRQVYKDRLTEEQKSFKYK